jgi:predicted type IV restriction endonuclease
MITVPFPPPQFAIRAKGEKRYIFDALRRRWLRLTEEEWVRQNMVAYFIHTLQYPKEMIALEKKILVNHLAKRFDIVVYDSQHQPWMLVECKAPAVRLDDTVLQQALRYHLTVPVKWLVLTNGVSTAGWKKEAQALQKTATLPRWEE